MGRNGELVLKSLTVRNFAIIEKIDLEFEQGLAVFTGETGAGKSILIEALGFLLGERGSTDWLRAGAAKLEVSGEFLDRGKTIRLRRELDAKGRSRAFLDGRPAKLSALAALGEGLVDFHGQHEHQSLLDPGTQLDLLDDFGGLAAKREVVAKAYRDWKEAAARRDAIELSEDERLRRIDLASFQISEIGETDPQLGEEEKLAAELPRLKNAGKLGELAAKAYGALYGEHGSTEESLGRAEESLADMARLDPSLEPAVAAIQKAREGIAEVSGELADRRRGEVSPEKLDAMIGRQDKIARLKRKYGGTVSAVLEFRDRAQRELDALENHELETKMVAKELTAATRRLEKLSEELHDERLRAAKRLASRAGSELKSLSLAHARMSIAVEMEEESFSPTGCDRVEFLIAPNPGEALKRLRQIASGGELSRVMLALKTVLARQDKVGLLVFDEVDTGVGAAVGTAVGGKLSELGRARQVFCVTHLAQVAVYASSHFQVSKSVADGRTTAKVERLVGEERTEAVARMLGGRKVTPASLKHAQELIGAA